MQRFKNGHVIAQFCQITGTGKSCRTGTDDSHLMTVQLLCLLRLDAMLSRPVCYKTLQLADRNRLALDAADTLSFTLVLLRTYTSTDCRKCG